MHKCSHSNSKLTPEQVHAIRRDRDAGMSGKEGAAKYGISANNFLTIGRRAAWQWLPEEGKES